MAFDILGALHRMITLPKASNSLADVLGADVADAISQIVHNRISEAVTAGLVSLAQGADKGAGHTLDTVMTYVTHAIGNVAPALIPQIQGEVGIALGNAEGVLLSDVAGLATKVTAAVGKVLKVSA